jgi:hypothetical protein
MKHYQDFLLPMNHYQDFLKVSVLQFCKHGLYSFLKVKLGMKRVSCLIWSSNRSRSGRVPHSLLVANLETKREISGCDGLYRLVVLSSFGRLMISEFPMRGWS